MTLSPAKMADSSGTTRMCLRSALGGERVGVLMSATSRKPLASTIGASAKMAGERTQQHQADEIRPVRRAPDRNDAPRGNRITRRDQHAVGGVWDERESAAVLAPAGRPAAAS